MVLLYGYGVDSGIEAITPRPISLTPEYYTLTGLRLQQPPHHGFYIVRQGNKTHKRLAK